MQNRAALRQEIESVFAGLTAAEVAARMERAQIANAELRDVEAFLGASAVVGAWAGGGGGVAGGAAAGAAAGDDQRSVAAAL